MHIKIKLLEFFRKKQKMAWAEGS